jgi:hypothetical protein
MGRQSTSRRLSLVAFASLLAGCAWVELGWGALTVPTTAPGESANVVAAGRYAYATKGTAGVEIVDLAGEPESRLMPLPDGESADDLAIADGLLFVLDAQPPGALSVYSLADPSVPALAQPPMPVDVGPFSGVSAAAGLVVVSGGTSQLSLRRYRADGRLDAEVVTADLGRGQPDVLLSPDGRTAFVSTHDYGPHFLITALQLSAQPLGLHVIGTHALDSYGFTPGGAKPANFPIELAIAGDLLLIATASGLEIVDASDPAALRSLATLPLDVAPVNVDARGGLAAVVGSAPAPRLVLVDFSTPTAPRVLRAVPLPQRGRASGVALGETQAIVAAHAVGTLVYELNPQGDSR